MLTKLAIFGLGYVLGARAGRARYDAMVHEARDIVQGEEASAIVGLIRGALWILSQRGRAVGRTVHQSGRDRS
ncbi:MAG: hypothetical protein ACREQM_18215 [Candidatus Dormibacteraceae bacterium]